MVKKMFNIAGMFAQAKKAPTANWKPFVCAAERAGDICIEQTKNSFSTAHAAVLSQHDELVVRAMPDGGWLFESPQNLAPAQVFLSANKSQIAFHLPEFANASAQQIKLNHLLRTALECRFCHEGIVSLHAACVDLNDCAIAFTGHSGLGKSTRAKAWVDGLGAQWISGDRPAVRLEKQGATACGVPWDGKEQIFRNVKKPLKCILEVRRSPENYVRRLSTDQARELLMQQSFVPMWDTDAAVLAMANVRKLVRKVPITVPFAARRRQMHRRFTTFFSIIRKRSERKQRI